MCMRNLNYSNYFNFHQRPIYLFTCKCWFYVDAGLVLSVNFVAHTLEASGDVAMLSAVKKMSTICKNEWTFIAQADTIAWRGPPCKYAFLDTWSFTIYNVFQESSPPFDPRVSLPTNLATWQRTDRPIRGISLFEVNESCIAQKYTFFTTSTELYLRSRGKRLNADWDYLVVCYGPRL